MPVASAPSNHYGPVRTSQVALPSAVAPYARPDAAAAAYGSTARAPVAPALAAAAAGGAAAKAADGDEHKKPHLRKAAGQVWEDNTLDDWPENDVRIFIGNLGKEVTDDMLSSFFHPYSSFVKARVVKGKGFGFASFLDPNDAVKAFREKNGMRFGARVVVRLEIDFACSMQCLVSLVYLVSHFALCDVGMWSSGKYVGNRPCAMRKSTWKDREIDTKKKGKKNHY
jgi:hypothetical protein